MSKEKAGGSYKPRAQWQAASGTDGRAMSKEKAGGSYKPRAQWQAASGTDADSVAMDCVAAQSRAEDPAASETAAALEEQPASKAARHKEPKRMRFWCHLFLTKGHPDFHLVPWLIGRFGCNMKEIHEATGAKIRIRGRGSGHREVDHCGEAPVPLMAAVTCLEEAPFRLAVKMMIAKLTEAQELFVCFMQEQGALSAPQRLWRFGEMSFDAKVVLADLLPAGLRVVVKKSALVCKTSARQDRQMMGMDKAMDPMPYAAAASTVPLLQEGYSGYGGSSGSGLHAVPPPPTYLPPAASDLHSSASQLLQPRPPMLRPSFSGGQAAASAAQQEDPDQADSDADLSGLIEAEVSAFLLQDDTKLSSDRHWVRVGALGIRSCAKSPRGAHRADKERWRSG